MCQIQIRCPFSLTDRDFTDRKTSIIWSLDLNNLDYSIIKNNQNIKYYSNTDIQQQGFFLSDSLRKLSQAASGRRCDGRWDSATCSSISTFGASLCPTTKEVKSLALVWKKFPGKLIDSILFAAGAYGRLR